MTMTVTGMLKFYNKEKGFGFIATTECDLHIGKKVAGQFANQLVGKVIVTVTAVQQYADGQFTTIVTAVTAVALPPQPRRVTLWAVVRWFDPAKAYGFVTLTDTVCHGEAYLAGKLVARAGVIPSAGMPMRATVEETTQGWKVLTFTTGPAILVEYQEYREALAAVDALALVAEEVVTTSAPVVTGEAMLQAAAAHAGNPFADALHDTLRAASVMH